MLKFIFNGENLTAVDAEMPVAALSSLYGKSIFTSIAVIGGKPFLWDKHWKRLTAHAEKIAFNIADFTESAVAEIIERLLKVNDISNGRIRLTFCDEAATALWSDEGLPRTSLLVAFGEKRIFSGDFRLAVSPYRINTASPLVGVKSGNYLEKIIALNIANADGFNEAIQLNNRGEIVSGVMANIFWLKGERLFTPSLKTGCLAGTTREFICENFTVNSVIETIETLEKADAIFLTSAGLGVIPVANFAGKTLPQKSHEILHIIK